MSKRVALITGGMGGLGETISTKMADAGYRVAVTYSPSNKIAAEWLKQMKEKGYDFKAFPCDVADYESCRACIEQVVKQKDEVDILVNNAGITKDMTFRKMDKAAWDAVIRTNLDSVFNMTRLVIDGEHAPVLLEGLRGRARTGADIEDTEVGALKRARQQMVDDAAARAVPPVPVFVSGQP